RAGGIATRDARGRSHADQGDARRNSEVQLTSQVLPPSAENACSQCAELAVACDQITRTRTGLPRNIEVVAAVVRQAVGRRHRLAARHWRGDCETGNDHQRNANKPSRDHARTLPSRMAVRNSQIPWSGSVHCQMDRSAGLRRVVDRALDLRLELDVAAQEVVVLLAEGLRVAALAGLDAPGFGEVIEAAEELGGVGERGEER